MALGTRVLSAGAPISSNLPLCVQKEIVSLSLGKRMPSSTGDGLDLRLIHEERRTLETR